MSASNRLKSGWWIRRGLVGLISLLLLLLLVALAGPRVKLTEQGPPEPPPESAALEAWLAAREREAGPLVPGTEKRIFWAGEPGRQTELSLIYLHGFSASRQETAPLSENLARALGANLFCTRYTGHGHPGGEALGRARLADWLRDSREALEIGRRLGKKVLVVGVSNGGALATWLACNTRQEALGGLVLLAPNFGLKQPGAERLLWPWGEYLARLTLGDKVRVPHRSPEHGRFWTTEYSSSVLPQMYGAVRLAGSSDLASLRVPVLMIHAKADQVVDTEAAARAFERMGSLHRRRELLAPAPGTDAHVIAGSIRSAANTPVVEAMILDFVRTLPTVAVPPSSGDDPTTDR